MNRDTHVAATSQRESILSKIADIDEWLDSGVSDRYQREPLAQHWARVAKVNEEAGEAIEALIAWTGQNPRKPQRDDARDELLEELADVALTAILGMQHFVKDADTTMWLVWKRLFRLHDRMREKVEADPERVQALYDVLGPDPDLYGDEPVFALYLYLNGSPVQADVFEDGSDFDTWPKKDEVYDPEA